jgi:hypothetical protein
MTEGDGQALNGKIEGLKLVLFSLIATMNAEQAAAAAKHLSESLADEKDCDVDEEGSINPVAEVTTRNQIADAYIKLLGWTAKRQ